MPTILRSSAVGKLRLGSTTTVPSPRSSGSLAGYRTAKVRCSSSKGTIGGADHIAKDNQSIVARAAPDFSESSFSARLVGAGGRRALVTASWGHDAVDHLLRRGRGRADLPAAGRRLLPPGGRRPGPAPPLPRGGPVRGRGAPAPVPDAVLGRPPHLQRDQGPPGPAHAPPPVRHRPGRARRLAAPHDRRRPGPGAARRAGRPPARVRHHGRQGADEPARSAQLVVEGEHGPPSGRTSIRSCPPIPASSSVADPATTGQSPAWVPPAAVAAWVSTKLPSRPLTRPLTRSTSR